MQTLIKTLTTGSGDIFAVTEGRRILLIKCSPTVRIYERAQNVGVIGAQGYKLKTGHNVTLTCAELDAKRNVDPEFLRTVSRFEFTGDFQRQDGVFERITFDNLSPEEIDLTGDWRFEVCGPLGLIKKLLAF